MLLAKALRDISEPNNDRKLVLIQNLKLAEKLAKTNLRIEFLTACRRSHLTPRFIQDSLKAVRYNFSELKNFNKKHSDFTKYLLNGSISAAFEEKAYLERKQKRLYEDLCNLGLDQNRFSWIKTKCRDVFWSTISTVRPGQVRKYQDLVRKSKQCQQIPYDTEEEGDAHDVSEQEHSVRAPQVARVKNLSSVVFDSATEGLLAKGPKFGITPRSGGRLLAEVEKQVERFAYGRRWGDEIERNKKEKNENTGQEGHLGPDSGGPPVDNSDTSAGASEQTSNGATSSLFNSARFPDAKKTQPPLSTRDTEDRLEKLKNSVLRIYRQHNDSDRNVTEAELAGLEDLRKKDDIVIKVSDKCKGLIILDKSDYVNKSKVILDDEINYSRLD